MHQRLIPSLLVRGGRLVKGVRFTDYRDAGNPATTARAHNAQGADELFVVDIDASKDRRPADLETIRGVAKECFMPLTVSGNIRSVEDARDCMEAGADKLCVTTTAMDRPSLISELAETFGSQAVVLGADIFNGSDGRRLFDHRTGTGVSSDWIGWIREGVERGAGEVRVVSVDQEGVRAGMDLEMLSRVRDAVGAPVILEGGAGTLDHLDAAFGAGADGVALGTMLVFSDNNLVKIKRFLASNNRNVRV